MFRKWHASKLQEKRSSADLLGSHYSHFVTMQTQVFRKWHSAKLEEKRKAREAEAEERRKKGLLNGREIFLQEGFVAQARAFQQPCFCGVPLPEAYCNMRVYPGRAFVFPILLCPGAAGEYERGKGQTTGKHAVFLQTYIDFNIPVPRRTTPVPPASTIARTTRRPPSTKCSRTHATRRRRRAQRRTRVRCTLISVQCLFCCMWHVVSASFENCLAYCSAAGIPFHVAGTHLVVYHPQLGNHH